MVRKSRDRRSIVPSNFRPTDTGRDDVSIYGTIESPCVDVCEFDEVAGLCRGCFRTLEEIGSWPGYTSRERALIIAALPKRSADFAQKSTLINENL